MLKPLKKNSPINARRYRRWTSKFSSYRGGVTQATIDSWFGQFEGADKDLAARILDAVMFFGQAEIASNFRSSLESLPGWHANKSKRKGRWFFVAMSASAGESGDSMLHNFRIANNLDGKTQDEMFIHRSQLVRQKLTENDTVVFVDDFSGTGTQVCEAWKNPELSYEELLTGVGKVYLMFVAATATAKAKISSETSMSLVVHHLLGEKDNLFSNKCVHFSVAEKATLLKYSTLADKKIPKGKGDCGLLVTFSHRCPNNSVPILHVDKTKWTGIFPRHD